MTFLPYFLAVMLLMLVLRDALPDHLRSRCLLCGGHIHAKDCPNRKEDDE